jgi:hemerythrin-like domain-containing protein
MSAPARDAHAHLTREHTRVAALVLELVRDAPRARQSAPRRDLRRRVATLRAAIERAIDVEERELFPLLRAVDAWGEARVERMRDRQARLLAVIRDLHDELARDDRAPRDVVGRTHDLLGALASHLEEEEDALFRSLGLGEGEPTLVVEQEAD